MHWRAMTTLDLPVVEAIAATVHPTFSEDVAVFAERQRLYPSGTQLLEISGQAAGYVLSHPWTFGQLPPLNALLGSIPAHADTYYIHDLALLNPARGTGAAAMIVGALLRRARLAGFPSVSLIAVNGSLPFWYKHGFRAVAAPELVDKLNSYEPAAKLMVRRF